ncbi:hypothetical protein ACLZX5_04095 [Enterococcus faecium]
MIVVHIDDETGKLIVPEEYETHDVPVGTKYEVQSGVDYNGKQNTGYEGYQVGFKQGNKSVAPSDPSYKDEVNHKYLPIDEHGKESETTAQEYKNAFKGYRFDGLGFDSAPAKGEVVEGVSKVYLYYNPIKGSVKVVHVDAETGKVLNIEEAKRNMYLMVKEKSKIENYLIR